MSKWREDHPKKPHTHSDLDHPDLAQLPEHLREMHGVRAEIVTGLLEDGRKDVRIGGTGPIVVHHRGDHRFAPELQTAEQDASRE